MSKGRTTRERAKIVKKIITQSLKNIKMKRGDEKQASYQINNPGPIQKPLTASQQNKIRLENLVPNELPKFIKDKCLYSNIYWKENITASETKFNYGGFSSDLGIKLDFENSEKEHYFGFELVKNPLGKNSIRIHYANIGKDGVEPNNATLDINSRKLSARKLVSIIDEQI
jgi:hypothetical protein